MNRKEFLKSICATGVCACGFSSILSFSDIGSSETVAEPVDKLLNQDWLANLISNLGNDVDQETLRSVLKKASVAHYNDLKMDGLLSDYVGKLNEFIAFLEKTWGWKIEYDEKTKTLFADENKSFCVCPILNHDPHVDTSAICYCSEGFAELMFSTVCRSSVTAEVISSVRKGDETCIYKISL